MAFPKHLLNHNEELILDLRPHWLFMFPSGGALLAALIIALATFKVHGGIGDVLHVGGGILILAALGWAGWKYLAWTRTNFVLTSDRIVTRRGVITKSGVEIPLERINTVFFKQGLFERMVGAGDLGIESAGERGSESFTNVRKPSVVQKEIYVQMEANENRKYERMHAAGGAPSQPAPAASPGSEVPAQIEKLAELHARGVLSDSEFAAKKAELLDRM